MVTQNLNKCMAADDSASDGVIVSAAVEQRTPIFYYRPHELDGTPFLKVRVFHLCALAPRVTVRNCALSGCMSTT